MLQTQEVRPGTVDLSRYTTINQSNPFHKMSDKYAFIPTQKVIGILATQDWHPVKIMEASTRREDREGYQKHLIRFRHTDTLDRSLQVKEEIPEIILTNSHDGGTAFNLMAGLFRLVCSNGLVVADSTFASHNIRHIGFKDNQVIDAVYNVVEETPRIFDRVNEFKSIALTEQDAASYAEAALMLKMTEDKMPEGHDKDFAIRRLLSPVRSNDAAPTLWNTFNKVQERFIKGGRFIPDTKSGKVRKTKEVKSVSENIRLNRALWLLTEKMAELKMVA